MFKRFIILLLVIAAVLLGTSAFYLRDQAKTSDMKAACMQKSVAMQQKGIVQDLEGFCECSIKVRQDKSTDETIKASGRACMDQYGKANLLKMCEDMNKDMKRDDEASIGLNCECFYDKLTSIFADEVNARKGADNMTKGQRDEIVIKAFSACKNETK